MEEIKFTKEDFLYQIDYVSKIFEEKEKEIQLKSKYIEELEFKSDMYKAMIQGIFDKI